MSLGDDLLDAIVAAPDDPAARLVYADHRLGFSANDAHAELIVVQERLAELEATGLWRDAFSEEAESLRTRESALIRTLDLAIDLPSLLATWRRGFIDTLTLNAYAPANLIKRIHHPAFRVVRAVRITDMSTDVSSLADVLAPAVRRLEGYFDDEHAHVLERVDEVSVPIPHAMHLRSFARLEPLERLELTETDYVIPDDVQRELRWGYFEARREAARGAEEHALAEQVTLAALIPKLPPAKHLAFTTREPLRRQVIGALAQYPHRESLESLRLHTGDDTAARALAGLGRPFAHVRFEALRDPDRELAARAEANIGQTYYAWGRPAEASKHYDDAFCFSEGRYPGIADRFAEAQMASRDMRGVTDPDPVRDGLVHRVPALLRWGQIDRVLAVAPNHRGAWALLGLRHRDDFELEEAEAAFAHALEDAALARAYALYIEDPPSALAVLNGLAPSVEANVLFASIHSLQSNPELGLGLLRDDEHALARFATGLLLRQAGRGAAARELWKALARVREGEADPERWLLGFYAATLAASDPYILRRQFHHWLSEAPPLRPRALLVFDPLIRVGNKVMPQVDSTMVSREVDRLRGA